LRRQHLHVAREDDEVGLHCAEALDEEVEVGGLVDGGAPGERDARGARDAFQHLVVGEHQGQLAVQLALVTVAHQLLQAVGLLGDQAGEALRLGGPAGEPQLHLHVDLAADLLEAVDQLVERAAQLGEVDQHGHDEEPLHDLLLDVLDVDVARGEIGGDAGDHALLVTADDGHDGPVPTRHGCDLSGVARAGASCPGPAITPSACSAVISSGASPRTSASTASVCSPSSGPGPRTAAGVSESRKGGPSMRTVLPSGVGTSTKWPRAASWGSPAQSSAAFATRPAATPAACRRCIATSASSVRVQSATCRSSSAACALRPAGVAKRGSRAQAGSPAPRTKRVQPSSSKTAIAIQRSSPAHGWTPCGAPAVSCDALPTAVEAPPATARSRSTGPSRLATASCCARSIRTPVPVRRRCQSAARTASAPRLPAARSE